MIYEGAREGDCRGGTVKAGATATIMVYFNTFSDCRSMLIFTFKTGRYMIFRMAAKTTCVPLPLDPHELAPQSAFVDRDSCISCYVASMRMVCTLIWRSLRLSSSFHRVDVADVGAAHSVSDMIQFNTCNLISWKLSRAISNGQNTITI